MFNIRRRSLAILAVYVAVHVILIQTLQQVAVAVDSASIRIELNENLLTLEARDESLVKVLGQIGELANFKVILVNNYSDNDSVNLALKNVPLAKAIELLVRDTNSIIFHLPNRNKIAQVWLLASNFSIPEYPPPFSDNTVTTGKESIDSRKRSKKVLRLANQAGAVRADQNTIRQIQATLIYILATDQDTLVRTRAAIALGKIGDDEAVVALEAASIDADSTVKAQSINALGQIDTIGAINALGGILLDINRPSTSRVMAAQALWKHNSDVARDYLRIGSTDDNGQVRQASIKPPPSLPERSIPGQRGQAESE